MTDFKAQYNLEDDTWSFGNYCKISSLSLRMVGGAKSWRPMMAKEINGVLYFSVLPPEINIAVDEWAKLNP